MIVEVSESHLFEVMLAAIGANASTRGKFLEDCYIAYGIAK
jgi:hypothetical protein